MSQPRTRHVVSFVGFWRGFDPHQSHFAKVLPLVPDARIAPLCTETTAVVFSDFGAPPSGFPGPIIYYSGENVVPDLGSCHFAITSSLLQHERHHHLPYWAFSCTDPSRLLTEARRAARAAAPAPPGFCSFVASNARAPERNRFLRILHRLRPVSSGGRAFNTTGTPVADKGAFLRSHRFNICFENTSSPGYTTEKLIDALDAGAIPIYWGNSALDRHFNTACMLRAEAFPNLDALAQRVIELDDRPEERARMLALPCFRDDRVPEVASPAWLAATLERWLRGPLPACQPRMRPARLRAHCYRSPLHQSAVSLACRVDALLWRMGAR